MSGTHPRPHAPGHVFGGYRIESVLGKGGFGVTYKATEVETGVAVALKECCPFEVATRDGDTLVPLPGRKEEFEDAKRRFYNEARLLYELEPHDGIVKVTHLFERYGTYYFAMKYIEGVMLIDYIRGGVSLDQGQLANLMRRLLAALDHLHERGVLHRDICPRNIMIREVDGEPMLIDFGAARIVEAGGSSQLTAIGKSHYGAIEQFIAVGKQGPWTDLHALGATLYELISQDSLPSVFERYSALMERRDDPRPALGGAAFAALPMAIRDMVEWATRFYPHERPQTAAALYDALEDGQAGRDNAEAYSKTWGRAPDLRDAMEDSSTRLEVAAIERNANDDEEIEMKPLTVGDDTQAVSAPEVGGTDGDGGEETPPRTETGDTSAKNTKGVSSSKPRGIGNTLLLFVSIAIVSLVTGYLIAYMMGTGGL